MQGFAYNIRHWSRSLARSRGDFVVVADVLSACLGNRWSRRSGNNIADGWATGMFFRRSSAESMSDVILDTYRIIICHEIDGFILYITAVVDRPVDGWPVNAVRVAVGIVSLSMLSNLQDFQ